VVVWHDLFQLEIDEILRVKRAHFLLWRLRVPVEVSSDSCCAGGKEDERNLVCALFGSYGGITPRGCDKLGVKHGK
jgi:hypothetical protein